MKFQWNPEKNVKLKRERGISFEEIKEAIALGGLLDQIKNPNYPDQQILIVNIQGYAVGVPCIENTEGFFLKTAYFSRKYTKDYLKGDHA